MELGLAPRRIRVVGDGPAHPGEPLRPVQWTALTAACAVLTMLANSMMPEAFERGGNSVGLLTVLGYLVAAALTAVQ